jgi:hypothetical protein
VARPDRIRIQLEPEPGSRFNCVGRASDGRQFMAFVTGAFDYDPVRGSQLLGIGPKRWMAVLHQFTSDGTHLATTTRLGGLDHRDGRLVAGDHASELIPELFHEAGIVDAQQCDISVGLFHVLQDGVLYGLVYEGAEDDEGEDGEHVMLEPNDIMFHPPWDGEYSS